MTEQELRIKIASILQSRAFENAPLKDVELGYITALDIADALIAANIGDVSEYKKHRIFVPKDVDAGCAFEPGEIKQLYGNEEVERIVKERDLYKRALQIAEKLGELCAPASNYIQQAEKELQEERKDVR